jgi:PAS domain S-box-containing protein
MASQDGWAALFWTAFKGSRNAMVLLDERRHVVELNGAFLKLVGHPRDELVGRPIYEFIVGGPRMTQREWLATIARGEFNGEAALVRADGTTAVVQYAGHTEVVTGQRRVLFVALSTSRSGRFARRVDEPAELGALSAREQEIVRLVAAGESGPEIAAQLHISYTTVRTHVRNAMTKVGARSRAHLVAKALGEGHALP